MRSKFHLAVVAISIAGGASIPAGSATPTYYNYDAKGRVVQRCIAMPGDGELAKYTFDAADNRTNYANTKTDIALYAGQALYSPNGNVLIQMQSDSNLVIYVMTQSGWSPTWATNTVGTGANVAYFQSDGNFVLYTPQGGSVWSSGTAGNPCSSLTVANSGQVTITNTSGTVVWSAP